MPTSSPLDAPVGEEAVVVLWLSQWNRAGPRARRRRGWRGRRGLLRRAVWNSSLELVPGYYR
jgi:hypothetical protein